MADIEMFRSLRDARFSQPPSAYVSVMKAYPPQMIVNRTSGFAGSDSASLSRSMVDALHTKVEGIEDDIREDIG